MTTAPLLHSDDDRRAPVPETMTAIVQDHYGTNPDDVLRVDEIALPTIGNKDVLVRVGAAGVDRGTWHLMAGLPYAVRLAGFGVRAPKTQVPGLDVSGTVEAVGRSVTEFSPGDEVFGIGAGSFAHYAVAPAAKLALKPTGLTFEQAAAVPVSGLTALQAVRDQAKIVEGQRILILGASGGVGSFAVQIAKAFGAHVTGVCSTAKVEMVRGLGADRVVDYTTEDLGADGARYDAILDIGGNRRLSTLRGLLSPDGRLVIVGGEGGGRWIGGVDRQLRAHLLSPFVSQTLGTFISSENGSDLVDLVEMIESGAVVPEVERAFPLDDAAEAVRHVAEGRACGKIVLAV